MTTAVAPASPRPAVGVTGRRARGRWLTVALLATGLLLAVIGSAQAQPAKQREADAEAKLALIREQLQALAEAQQALLGQRATEANRLRDADQGISQAQRQLRELASAIDLQALELQRLQADQSRLGEGLQQQRAALAGLVRSVYALGRHEQIKLLLAQDSIDSLNRSLIYHRYLQQDRLGRVRKLLDAMAELAAAQTAVADKATELEQTRAQQQATIDRLAAQRVERGRLIAELDRQYQDSRNRQRELGRDEAALKSLLESLRDIFADIPHNAGTAPIDQRRGHLPRPAAGKLRVGYAGTLPDGRASSGWWIEAASGSEVRAIAHGRVAFADWMKGYGLLLIVDHSDGYMSLYAGNDALLVDAGDWIEAGRAIATTGTSGGFPAAGVYFELRNRGRPLDPAVWLQKQ